jgi:hypothetical protein
MKSVVWGVQVTDGKPAPAVQYAPEGTIGQIQETLLLTGFHAYVFSVSVWDMCPRCRVGAICPKCSDKVLLCWAKEQQK